MDKLIKKHHSLIDWEFEPGNEYYLDATTFISSPSSLAVPLDPAGGLTHYVFLKEAVSGSINDGQFITALRQAIHAHRIGVYFRQSNDLSNCANQGLGDGYKVEWDRTNTQIIVYRAGIAVGYLTSVPNPDIDTWHYFKVSWYSYINPGLDRIVRIHCYVKVNGEWHDCGYWEDSHPLHEDDPVNRIGFHIGGVWSDKKDYADDTQIWEKP